MADRIGIKMMIFLKQIRLFRIVSVLLLVLSSVAIAQADELLVDDYPDKYTVVQGDTLWDIAARFLKDPWRWPEIWKANPYVENPDLIFPDDLLVLTFEGGNPVLKALRKETVKLGPSIREQALNKAIPTIDPSVIQPYLSAPLVTSKNELTSAGYVVEGLDGKLVMGKYDQFYARGVKEQDAEQYRVFRPGRKFINPLTGEHLGWEAEHVADVRLLKGGDTARFTILKNYTEVTVRDRLRPVTVKATLPYYYPAPPKDKEVYGVILDTQNKSTELGALSVVAISLGEREGIEPGNVLRIKSEPESRKDPVTKKNYKLPEEPVGLLMVFKTFEKVSYAIVTNASRAIKPGYTVVSPEWKLSEQDSLEQESSEEGSPKKKKKRFKLPCFFKKEC